MIVLAKCESRVCGWAGAVKWKPLTGREPHVEAQARHHHVGNCEPCPACGERLDEVKDEADTREALRQHVGRYLLMPVDATSDYAERAFHFLISIEHRRQDDAGHHEKRETVGYRFSVSTLALGGRGHDDSELVALVQRSAESARRELTQTMRGVVPGRGVLRLS